MDTGFPADFFMCMISHGVINDYSWGHESVYVRV